MASVRKKKISADRCAPAWAAARGSSAAEIPERRGKQTEAGAQPEAPRRLSQDDFALRTKKLGESDELSCFQTQGL